jgi:hypothetical protein
MEEGARECQAPLHPHGKALITRSAQIYEENHADLYDPLSGTFTRTGDLINFSTVGQFPPAIPGQNPTAVLLTNGKVLIAGDAQDGFYSTIAEIYDPASGAFSVTGTMPEGIAYWQAGALLPEGKVLISGESSGANTVIAELYDPVTGTFSAPIVSQSAEGHAATLLPDGTLLVSGGWFLCGSTPIGVPVPGCGGTIASARIYHPGVLIPTPQLFSVSGDGRGQGAVWHANSGQVASSQAPAIPGEVLSMYTTSLADDGAIPPRATIGGLLAEVEYFGGAPGYPGYNQVNVRVPSGVTSGSDVPVRLNYLNRPSNEVTIGVH